jgi:hypothetical protein
VGISESAKAVAAYTKEKSIFDWMRSAETLNWTMRDRGDENLCCFKHEHGRVFKARPNPE